MDFGKAVYATILAVETDININASATKEICGKNRVNIITRKKKIKIIQLDKLVSF